jgi:hypothetical protein
MKIIDNKREDELKTVGLYLTVEEATWLRNELNDLLEDPEAMSHLHIRDLEGKSSELSCSIITEKKLKEIHNYNPVEQRILSG